MRPIKAGARLVPLVGGLCLLAALAAALLDPGNVVRNLRENVFDRMLIWSPRPNATSPVIVVEIGRDALAEFGPWPWPRSRLAELVDRIAHGQPKSVAINIVLSPRETTEADPADEKLAQAIARVPTVLAMLLDPAPSSALSLPSSTPIATQGVVEVPDLLQMPGVVLPAPAFVANARGLGVTSLPAEEGQPVRSVYLLAAGADTLFAGFAVETVKAAEGSSNLIASAPPQALRVGRYTIPLPHDGTMRLHFATRADRSRLTIPAEALLSGRIAPQVLAGKIVMLGASAPEAGGLRLTPADPFMPSVEIEAEAVEQVISGHIPTRPEAMAWIEIAIGGLIGVLGILSVIYLSPARALVAVAALSAAWIAIALMLSTRSLLLTDPLIPVLIALIAVQGAGLTQFARTYRQRVAIERRFALHLPPEIIRRIVENPKEIGFAGETRMITALITDIEGFTALTERIGPEATISLLDRYIETVAGIIVSHGGMVDKIVGDAFHAFFNAPLDLPDHAEKAVTCACAIVEATERLRQDGNPVAAQLGRTRIGIETGLAVLGDVGRGSRRDYTAYGRAVNLASRLEGANKRLGTSVLLGPGTVAELRGRISLRNHGMIEISGLDEKIQVFEPESVSSPQIS
ncbi:adenylate/guanylate cyclase domain-containing protein [Nordella sp. HKS 07]|nr:adenylate/guanylate cyclase domain-containing protein [Nordella sp. HKS 07]QIG49950.1 adenylate/guanylate cyclase domain-containing protein [Nordella sp. HKS 07]